MGLGITMTTEAHCDCTGSPPWPAMIRLHAGGPKRYYLCPECGAVKEDIYQGGAITSRRTLWMAQSMKYGDDGFGTWLT